MGKRAGGTAPALDQVRPLHTTRWADDAEGAVDLAVLLDLLLTAAERRRCGKAPAAVRP
ncbi:hypothetical protein ACQPZG_03200 (plasmid) [Streptomyces sp. CA-294286]|uniref:hypothetical protein n=1 Tax=Streptomyces sp. CA-294286 TaxID=3240070 RepID=UPI003D8D174B